MGFPKTISSLESIMYSVDWAVKKRFQIYNVNLEKLKSISPTREAFDKFFNKLKGDHSFYIEEGGGDTFKLLALKYGHQVFTISGRIVKELREKLELPESDENSARVIGILAKEQPQEFYEYKEDDKLTLKICLLSREYGKLVEDSTRSKNQLFALKNKMELLTSEKAVKKVIEKRKNTIKALGKEITTVQGLLFKQVKQHSFWVNCLKDVKGVGPVAAAGIIGSVKRFSRFPNKYSLRHFAGMIMKKDNVSYNRYLKQALYNFVEGIIKSRTQPWRQLYDDIKVYYRKNHSDWEFGKIDNYAKKFVQTKFLDMLWKKGIEIGN